MKVMHEKGERGRGRGIYPMEKYNVNKIDKEIESNLLNGILRPAKRAKIINSHYSPILHECMNTRNGRVNFNNFRFVLNSG